MKTAIFSIYTTPEIKNLNFEFFNYVMGNYKKLIIIGDLNASLENGQLKRNRLEGIIAKGHLHILNNKTPTFLRSKNVLDLSICSS